jgi:uncharacterized damage-inducible protein DinB
MLRVQFIEINDEPWFPSSLRNNVTDALQFGLSLLKGYAPIAPLLLSTLDSTRSKSIIDLCSGGGGPWLDRLLLGAVSVTLLAATMIRAKAQGNAPLQAATNASPAPPTSGFRAEFLNELKYEEDRFIRLAQAMPADKYTWRPAEGVRSVSEVYMHVAAANYNLPHLFGMAPPAGFKVQGFDKSTSDKTKVIETLQNSFAHMREAALNMSDTDLEKQLDWFEGKKNTYRGVMVFILRHAAEHLGQSIAYARFNGIVPPWTQEQQREQEQKPKK